MLMFLTEILHLKRCPVLYHPGDAVFYKCTQLPRAAHWLFIFACLNYIYPIKVCIQIISNLLSFTHFGVYVSPLTWSPNWEKYRRRCVTTSIHFSVFFFCFTWTFFSFLMEEGSLVWVFLLWLLFGFFTSWNSDVLWLLLCHCAPQLCLSMEMIKVGGQRCSHGWMFTGAWQKRVESEAQMWALCKVCLYSTYSGATDEHTDETGSTDPLV